VRLYPDVRSRRLATLLRDVAVVVALVLLAWLGLAVHEAVDRLAVVGEGVADAGTAVQGGFESAAEQVERTPLIGDRLAGGLREAGEGTAGNVADLGRQGEEAAHDLALLLGLLVFGLPAVVLLAHWLPRRIAEVRQLTAAARVLADPGSRERQRAIATRAAMALPYGQLLRFTRDPLGDLVSERYDRLVAAALDDAGLRAP
jgi:hypothetical protein